MKIIGTIGGVVIASIAMLQPAEAGHRGGGRSFSSGFHGSGGARSFAAPSRSFSGGGARFYGGGARYSGAGARYSGGGARYSGGGARYSGGGARFSGGGARYSGGGTRIHNSSTRFSSGTTFRNQSFRNSGPRYSGNRNRFNNADVNNRGGLRHRTDAGDGTRFTGNGTRFNGNGTRFNGDRTRFNGNGTRVDGDRTRVDGDRTRFNGDGTGGFRNRGGNIDGNRVVGHRGGNWNRHWDKRRDHYWNGHRCRWINNSWVIFAAGFYPYWGYYPYGGYYPYDYGYYDDGYYADSYASNQYTEQPTYDTGATDANVSAIQSALSREGYYSGAIDGTLGPETRSALRRYQRDRSLSVTGRIDRATMNALGLR